MTLAYDYAHLAQLVVVAARLVRDIAAHDPFPDGLLTEADAAELDHIGEIAAERYKELEGRGGESPRTGQGGGHDGATAGEPAEGRGGESPRTGQRA